MLLSVSSRASYSPPSGLRHSPYLPLLIPLFRATSERSNPVAGRQVNLSCCHQAHSHVLVFVQQLAIDFGYVNHLFPASIPLLFPQVRASDALSLQSDADRLLVYFAFAPCFARTLEASRLQGLLAYSPETQVSSLYP